ncbi:serine/threonine-protein kinase pim-2-like [Takifugu rubripes]|uniref:serine/threonine-protein kinase pim-2-like n=1 Tax=Takifugu rubripes TaxID=31033 RepID=UPI001146086B|nr:serine/threonine-protein kinase pim-2-like [Takifugu rubripes]
MQQLQLLLPFITRLINLVINPAVNEEKVQGAQQMHQVNVQRERQPPRWGTLGHQMNPAVTSAPTGLEASEPAPNPYTAARVHQSYSQRSTTPKAALTGSHPIRSSEYQRSSHSPALTSRWTPPYVQTKPSGKKHVPKGDHTSGHCQPGTKTRCGTQKADGKNHPGQVSGCSKSVFAEEYEKHYREVSQLGEGGFGTVFSGYRRHDLFPVAIKHIAKDLVKYQPVVINGELHCAPLEMVLMVMTAGDSVGENAVVSPLAWIDLDDEILLIMERPENCMNLFEYDNGQIDEGLAKEFMRQLVEAAIQIHKAGIFHRDLKLENILIQFSDARLIPRVRIIDFGCGCFVTPGYRSYAGTHCFRPPEFNHRGTYEAGPTTVWQLGCILLELLSENTDMFTKGMQHCENFLTQTIKKLKVSEDCKKFLKSCLLVNPDQRITQEQMLCHPWFRSSVLPEAQP